MKVSINWLKQLVDLKVPVKQVVDLLPLRTIGTKEVTDDFIELDMKGYNRADLLSMRGVSLEIAAITDSKVTFREDDEFVWANQNLPKTSVKVETKLCPTYCVAKITGLKVGFSPKEWINKLEDAGMRSVNNIADITNLVMLEFGQPLHAFDAQNISDETLIVRTANPDEKIITLDGKVRELLDTDLVIADCQKSLGLAGVMGGANSEVTDSTTTILLEAAIFDPVTIRKTATRLGLQSEASRRFQHGLTKKRLLQALEQAFKMYENLGGKLVAISLTGNLEDKVKTIDLHLDKVNSLIGIELKPEQIENYLTKLGFKLSSKEDLFRAWEVEVPFYRLDVEIEEDLIEEVARMYGYEKIPSQKLKGKQPDKIDQSLFELQQSLRTDLVKAGLTEVQTYSFYSTKVIENLNLDRDSLIQIANPISAETEYLRDNIWPNLVEATCENLKYFKEVAIFEIGKVYFPKEHDMPEEEYRLTLALSNNSNETISQLFTLLGEAVKPLGWEIKLGSGEMNDKEQELFHPVRFAQLVSRGQRVGQIAEVHPRIVNKFGVEKRIAIIELQLPQ